MRTLLQEIGGRIDRAERLLVVNPLGGDGDSLGSSLALAQYRTQRHRVCDVFACAPLAPTYAFLPGYDRIVSDPKKHHPSRYDCCVVVDCAQPSLLGVGEAFLSRAGGEHSIIVIDHHQSNIGFGDINYIDPTAAATSEIIFSLFTLRGWTISADVATNLLTGIIADTNSFTNRNTTTRSLSIASKLVGRGANYHRIRDHAFRNKSIDTLRLWGVALERLRRNPKTGTVTTFISQNDFSACGVNEEAAEGIANFLNKLGSTPAVCVLREAADGSVKGSLRTTRDDVDVAQLAQRLHGGGHRRAAGFVVDRASAKHAPWNDL